MNAWSPFAPTVAEPWDLRRVVHLHRRAGLGATWAELQRDVREGPAVSIETLLDCSFRFFFLNTSPAGTDFLSGVIDRFPLRVLGVICTPTIFLVTDAQNRGDQSLQRSAGGNAS